MEVFGFCITNKLEVEWIKDENVKRKIKEWFENTNTNHVVLTHNKNIYVVFRLKEKTRYEIAKTYSSLVRFLSEEFKKKEEVVNIVIDNIDFDHNFIYETILLSKYSYRNNKREVFNPNLIKKSYEKISNKEIETIVEGVYKARDLINLSVDEKSPEIIAKKIIEDFKDLNVNIKIIKGEDLKNNKLNLIYSVGKGSDKNPLLMLLEYKPNSNQEEYFGLVGKGVVFDAGGYNIKLQMIEDMKLDVSGAVISAYVLWVLARLKIRTNMIVALPLVENLVSGRSYKPGDVILSYEGKGVEIINTDAEGRLILADALSYLQKNYKVKEIVDIATLTGACMIALGKDVAGIMGEDKMVKEIVKIGLENEERFWQLPLWDEYYKDMLKSEIADIKNLPQEPWAGAIVGGMFLKQFVNVEKWVHIDIAGPSYTKKPKLFYSAGATAFGLRSLVKYFISKVR